MIIPPSFRRRSLALLAAFVCALAVMEGAMGASFLFLAPGFAQHVWGTASSFIAPKTQRGYLGGVVVLQNGTVLAAECLASPTRLHRYDPVQTEREKDTTLHKETVLPTIAGGCGITFHPDGFIYSNMDDGTFGLSRIDPATLATTKMGPRGNAIGITVDPVTNEVVYAGLSCKPGLVSPAPATCTLYAFDVTTGSVRTFATLPTSQIAYVDGMAFDPSGTYLFLTNRFPAFELVVLSRSGAIVRRNPAPADALGIAFHAASPKFVVTNNQNGTMTRFDFPGDDYSAAPTATEFAAGGFRGDLMQAGPDGCLYLTQDGTRYDNFDQDRNNSIVQICGGFAPPPGITPNPPAPSSLCGFAYNDADNDGTKENGEAGISGVTINLSGTDRLDLPVTATTTTKGDGSYCFTALPAGTFTISESQPGAYLDGRDTQGTPGGGTVNNDSIANITLDAGVNGANNNFGELLPSSLGGFVYVDADNNGTKGAGEATIAGAVVTLTGTDDRGTAVNMPGATGSDGAYLFTNLRPGTYTITETQPAGYLDGKDTQGTPGTGTTGNDAFSNITLKQDVNGRNNNFGELIAQPALALVKKTNGFDNPAPPGRLISVGAAVTWTYLVTNTGNEPLSTIAVTDDKVPTVTCPATTLDPGMNMTCSATGVAVAGQYTNTGTATGKSAAGTVVTATDADSYFGAAPAIALVTKTNGTDNNAPPGPSIVVGSAVTWSYTLTNTGNVALSNVAVTDDRLGTIACPSTTLAPAATMTCSKSGTATAGAYKNVGTVTAKDGTGTSVTATDPENYFGVNAVLAIVTMTNGTNNDAAPGPAVVVGSTVTWTYTVSNAGNVALSQVAVSDDKTGAVVCPATTLAPGAFMTCTKTGVAFLGAYTNTGVATAVDTLGRTVSAQDVDHYLGVQPPASDLAISMTGPASGMAGTGGLVYRTVVANNGPSLVNAPVVSVPLPAGMTLTSVAAPPAGWTCSAPGSRTFTCTKATMTVGETAALAFTVALSCPFPTPAPATTLLTATATSATDDPALANNIATIRLSVVNPAPTISGVLADPASLWPPNHKMESVQVSYTVTPACGGTPTVTLGVTSNEGDSSDWQILDLHRLNLRSERLGTQKEGRVYTITITATDPSGSSAQKTVLVTVPHDQGNSGKGK